jgi:hypothetical protein
MILRLSIRQSGLALLVPVFCFAIASHSPAEENKPGRPIEFSDPKGSDISTNVNQFSLKKSLLREFEDDLTKSFHRSLSSHGSLDGVAMPPPQTTGPTIQSKRLKEQLDRKKNWAFNTPEDLTSTPTLEELLHLPDYATDPDKKKSRSSVERYYQSLERKRPDGRDDKKEHAEAEGEKDRESEDSNIFGLHQYEVPEDTDSKAEKLVSKDQKSNEGVLNRLFNGKSSTFSGGEPGGRDTEVNIFGMGGVSPTVEQVEAHKAYLERFKAIIGPTTTTTSAIGLPNTGLDTLRDSVTEMRNSLSGVANLQTISPATIDIKTISAPSSLKGFDGVPSPSILGSAMAPVLVPDLGLKENQFSTPAALPRSESTRFPLPTSPSSFQRQF